METLYYLTKLFVECKTNNGILDAMLEILAFFYGSNCCHAKLEKTKIKEKTRNSLIRDSIFNQKQFQKELGIFLENFCFSINLTNYAKFVEKFAKFSILKD